MSSKDIAILVVDDEEDFAQGLSRMISRKFPNPCLFCSSGDKALGLLDEKEVGVLITDLRMPGMDGLQLMKKALGKKQDLSVIMLTAYGTIDKAVEAMKEGAYNFLTKPLDPEQLEMVLNKALERIHILKENTRLKELISRQKTQRQILGESTEMVRLLELIKAVAATGYTVLIRGESGTGKELVARTIHDLSQRRDEDFVSVNCPAIPSELMESELFGHARGAFTGAEKAHKGLFLQADKGTILLDEIGDIRPEVQTKLLRVLQEQEIRPVGGSKNIGIDVRILATTNQDLEEKIKTAEFREDLFYRLNVLCINVPPLRERKEDIPVLVLNFVHQTCKELNIAPKDVEPEAQAYLAAKNWPGNVRELLNFTRRLVVFCSKESIDLSLVRVVENMEEGNSFNAPPEEIAPYKEHKAAVVHDFTRVYVRNLLQKTKGNISEAARISGLERVSLQKILRRIGIDAEEFRKQ
ncbi:MAG: sigma-54-dependent transcriptional regulator [Desulfonatronovibrionaceae bacterium]